MEERKKLILETIIKEHIATGCPVPSSVVVEKYHIPVSSATVRNDMAELEEEGWIVQPYTSAGRIPTARAYEQYSKEIKDQALSKKEVETLTLENLEDELATKQIAKHLASLSGLAVVWAFHKYNVYYTGISNLLQQPEFAQPQLVYDISSIMDRIDDIVGEVFDKIEFEPQIMIGENSPFGVFSSAIMTRFKTKDKIGLIGLIGPVRMDYQLNKARINHLLEQIK